MPPQLKSFFHSIRRKPKTADSKSRDFKTADGRTEAEAAAAVGSPQVEKTTLLQDVTHLGPKNSEIIAQAVTTLASGQPLDDKELLLEHSISMLQGFPPNSSLSQDISDGFISMLWSDLPHPSATMCGPMSRYRRHDGGGNNPWDPELGKAGSPYARNVPPMKPKGPNLPDVESVYEALMKRKGPFRKHPTGLNRLFFSFATVVIHECFQTSRTDHFINTTSSYVDLSTLYGNTDVEQPRVRTYKNGTIYPDSIASDRIMLMPPGVIAVLLMFSRNHNAIAASLLSVNEDRKYKSWESMTDDQQIWQDEDIFQISRNINVGFFASVVLGDYVAAILNTARANSQWSLNLGKEIKELGVRGDRGRGNLVSVEFSVLYHWHAALSAADDRWMQDLIKEYYPKITDMDDVDVGMFQQVMYKYAAKLAGIPPKDWTFNGLKRQADGRFNDTDLAEIIKSCIEEPAHAFGAHGTPNCLKAVDMLGMIQARDAFNVCTMNEFRKYLNLKEYSTFEEWNPDKETARAAELLYGHIDNLELYPGLMAECTKPPVPGSGVCPGQTTGRGILDDAVSLVRGDRFLSYDFNSNTLTNYGAATLQQHAPGSYGTGMIPRLILSGLPDDFNGTSSYALLAFYTPEAAKEILTANKVIEKYDTTRPPHMEILSVQTQAGCKQVLEDHENFKLMYKHSSGGCTKGHDFMIGWDESKFHDDRSDMLKKALFESDFEKNVSEFFADHVNTLIRYNTLSFTKGKRSFDFTRDVANIVPIQWLADRFAIPIKTADQPRGIISIYDAFNAYLSVYRYENMNLVPVDAWALREAAVAGAGKLRPVFETHIKSQRGLLDTVVDWLAKGSGVTVGPHAERLYRTLHESKLPVGDLVADCVGMTAPVAANLAYQASLLVSLYLTPGYKKDKARIVELAKMEPAKSEAELRGFVFEGMRITSAVLGVPRVATKDVVVEDGARGKIEVKAGQTVLAATSKAAMDPAVFKDPGTIDPLRKGEEYGAFGAGLSTCFGARLVGPALAAVLREVFKLKNVHKAAGKLGSFTVVEHEIAGLQVPHFLDSWSTEQLVPTSMTLEYDA